MFRFSPARELQANVRAARGPGARPISDQTVRNRIHAAGFHSRKAALKPRLTQQHMVRRLQWGQEKVHWRRHQWQSCLFVDESKFCLKPTNQRLRKWRRRGERRHDPNLVNHQELFGGGGVMVWGGIRHNAKTDLVIIEGNSGNRIVN